MSTISILTTSFKFNRTRTLSTLDEIEKLADPAAALAFRLGPGRAHIGWQLMHIAVTEEIFGCERLVADKPGKWSALWPRFRGGSQADNDVPTAATIRQVLEEARASLLETLETFSDEQLRDIPPALAERGWSLRDVLHIISWHESHHQGQAHIMLNSYRASQL